MVISSLLSASVSAQSTQKPQRPTFNVEINDHSYESQPVYQFDQFTGENVLVSAGQHYEWRTLDFTIQNQQSSQGELYYNFRYRGQYATNWTNVFYEGRYVKAQSGQISTIPFLISGQIPSGQGDLYRIGIPEGASCGFRGSSLLWQITRGSPNFGSGNAFTGEASEWSDAVSVTFGEIASTNLTPSTNPTTNHQSTPMLNDSGFSFEQITIIALSTVVVFLVVALMLMHRRNVRKNML